MARCSVLGLLPWSAALGCATDEAMAGAMDEPEPLACDPESGLELFERRIEPLLAEDRPSSCTTCHLAGLDLGAFVQGDPCTTMACMDAQGLVNLVDPEQSLVLSWIGRATPDSALVTEEVIAQEYAGMLEWIEYSARCGDEACGPIEDPCADRAAQEVCEVTFDPLEEPEVFDDPGDCSDATLEGLFQSTVFSWRGRCFPCHFETEDFDAPKWIRSGNCEIGAVRTMRAVVELGVVDLEDPASSLLLLKPLDEAAGGVPHEGHAKISDTQEAAYVDFLRWLERYAACRG
jgi:hypothetical protein